MTITLGPIRSTSLHFTTDDCLTSVPRTLCERGGGRLEVGVLHGFTSDKSKVTCQSCIEWMHA